MAGRILAEDQRPQFFLSYARSRFRPSGADPDRYVRKLFDDLSLDVHQATGMPVPGFMDRQIPLGTDWPGHVADALANCRVLVALLSPAYFGSGYCGQEWAAFQDRVRRYTGNTDRPLAVVPALWTALRATDLPPPVQSMQNMPPGFPTAYASEGLYGIMKLGRYREAYKETVFRLAGIIKERAEECDLPAGPVPALDTVVSPFAPVSAVPRPLRVAIAAHALDQLPADRDGYYYGRTALEWTPFRDQVRTASLAHEAADALDALGLTPIVAALELTPASATEPTIVVVDPWVARDPGFREALSRIVQPSAVLVPYNDEDAQTAGEAADLAERLEKVLRPVEPVRSADAFRSALARAANRAVGR